MPEPHVHHFEKIFRGDVLVEVRCSCGATPGSLLLEQPIQISKIEQDHHAKLRADYHQLALERMHIRR